MNTDVCVRTITLFCYLGCAVVVLCCVVLCCVVLCCVVCAVHRINNLARQSTEKNKLHDDDTL